MNLPDFAASDKYMFELRHFSILQKNKNFENSGSK